MIMSYPEFSESSSRVFLLSLHSAIVPAVLASVRELGKKLRLRSGSGIKSFLQVIGNDTVFDVI